eukprot:361518-Chlamydomonas_euryale.AAC.6
MLVDASPRPPRRRPRHRVILPTLIAESSVLIPAAARPCPPRRRPPPPSDPFNADRGEQRDNRRCPRRR